MSFTELAMLLAVAMLSAGVFGYFWGRAVEQELMDETRERIEMERARREEFERDVGYNRCKGERQ